MTSAEYHKVFERFKPVCVKLLREHTLDNVKELHKILQVPVEPEILQQLQEYILFPLRLIQKQSPNKCETFRSEVITCQVILLNQTEVDRFEMFQDMFTSLCISLSSTDPENKVAPLCEELKLALVQCLSALINSTTVSVLEQIYQASFLPPMGHAVSLLLHLAETEGMRQLRQDAMTCIQDLAALNRKVPTKLQVLAGDVFASFLPGISMAMTKVATGDCKQGHLVTKAATDTWAGMVSLVLGDKYLNSEHKHRRSETNDKPYDKLVVIRSRDWIAVTTEKLKILISKMASIANNNNWRVRLAMVEWADRLLTNCSKSLELCTSDLLNVLVSRVADEYEKVASTSRQALITLQKISATKNKTFVEILEENLHVLTTHLPRLMRTSDDDTKVAHLCLFNGYLRLLGPHMDSLLNSSIHLQHLSAALLQVLELDCSGLHIIQEKTPAVLHHGLEVRNGPGWLKKSFKHFTDQKIEKELVTICHLIGYYGDLDIVLDHFLERFMQSSLHRKQAAFILNQVIVGCPEQDLVFGIPTTCKKEGDTLLQSIRMIIEEYLQPEHWNLPTSNQSSDTTPTEHNPDWLIVRTNHRGRKTHSLTVEQINSNILQICLMLEGLAEFAKVLAVNFRPLLMDVLYPILEKLGDDNNSVSQTAYTALCYMYDACQYSNIQDLILSNADYLVNSISLRLRHLGSNPKAPLVLKVTVTYSNKDILPVIDDTITEVFESLDCHYEEKSLMFLQVLHALVISVSQWFPVTTSKNSVQDANIVDELKLNVEERETRKNAHHSLQDIGAFFMEYLQQRRIVESMDSDEREMDTGDSCVENDDEHNVEMESDVKSDPPKHIVIVKQVMERCVHLLASPSPRLRLLVLDTIAQCSRALQTHQDELLPLVHKIWPPFVLRFTDEEKLVIVKACYVLCVLADTSGDFIRQRVVKDVIPKVTDLLYQLAPHSQKTGPAYRFTTACRLQLAILENIGLLTSKIGLRDHHLAPVLEASLPYLSCKQNSVLQQAAIQVWLRFAEYQPDYVWLVLNNVYSPETLQPPHECFKEIQMPGSRTRNEYTDNIEKILSIID